MKDIVIISAHERGFWQADLYRDASDWDQWMWNSSPEPDGFFTMPDHPDVNLSTVRARTAEKWPEAEIREVLDSDDDEDWDE